MPVSRCIQSSPWQVWIALALVFSGCGGTYESTVSGIVLLDEQALTSGTVTFHPLAGGAAVYGQIQSDGRYELHTGSERGLAPGDYRVTVVATDNPPAAPGQTPPIGKLITPERYNRLETTDLQATIKPGKNDVPLKLHST
jgi:hypothetical protein